jgi:4-amino-4-deoxy-L-arabinose transferase-like glycosyltransferase
LIARTLRSPLAVVLIAYILLASIYSVVTPIFEASDELWHYPLVKYMADHALALPVQDPAVKTEYRQEGSQPPLYYMLGAILTFWIDTSDLSKIRHINPHADIGVVLPDGNINMIMHNPDTESFPWRGTVLAVHLVRLFSVVLGAVTVAMTYLLARELFPSRPWLAFVAAAFTAFNPMFLFISGSVNNDNLSNALASILLVLIVRLLKKVSAPSYRELVLIGLIAGAGMLAKFNIGFLLPIIALALAILAYRQRNWRIFVVGSLITGGLTVLIAGWWYLRNMQLYGDPTGLNMFIRIVGPRTIPANLPQLWSERFSFLMSYWGFFGGVNVPMPELIYAVFNGIAAISVVGLLIGLILFIRRKKWREIGWPILLGRAVTAMWIVVLFVSLLRWTSATWASQGRLIFSAIAPLSLWMAVGLWSYGKLRVLLAGASVTWFAAAASLIAPMVIWSSYFDPYRFNPPIFTDTETTVKFCESSAGHPCMGMGVNSLFPDAVQVGDYLQFSEHFTFTKDDHFTRDWSVFIHLVNNDGLIIAQRDVNLGQGQWATSQMKIDAGSSKKQEWLNSFAIRVPGYAYAPQMLDVYLGFYDLKSPTYERLIVRGNKATPDNRVLLGTVKILPREGLPDVPNAMNVNFGNEAELVGYDVSDLLMVPYKTVKVTLYWRARRPMTNDYRVFVHVLDPATTSIFGGDDAMPAVWTRPTSSWKPDEIIKDEHTFKVSPDAPPGIWQIEVGIYQLTADNQFRRLRVITPDGGEADDFLYLSRIKMDLAPEVF